MILTNKTSFKVAYIEGKSEFAYVNSAVASFKGKETGYSMNVVLDEKQLKEVKAICEEILSAAQDNPEWTNFEGNKVAKKSWLPKEHIINTFLKEREGKSYIVVKAPHENSKGERLYIPMFNAFGRLSDDETKNKRIMGGSTVNVEVAFYVYYVSANMQGIKAKLRSVQIVDEPEGAVHEVGSGFHFKTTEEENDVPI